MSRDRARLRSILQSIFSRYTRGTSTAAENDFVERLYEQVPEEPITNAESQRIGDEIKAGVYRHIQQDKLAPRRLARIYIPAAACVALLLGFMLKYGYDFLKDDDHALVHHVGKSGVSLSIGKDRFENLRDTVPEGTFFQVAGGDTILNLADLPTAADNKLITLENTDANVFSLLLADGTTVNLYKSARISFNADFMGQGRYVSVQGKVFFDVASQLSGGQKVPFRVETALQTIDVLGTEFLVDAREQNEENVFLKEGRVKLTHRGSQEHVLLKAGQQAFLAVGNQQIFVTADRDPQKVAAWRKKLFYFEDQSLGAVMEELSTWYGMPIHVDANVGQLPITGTFTRYPALETVLEIIEMTNNISYYEKKGVFYVNKK